MFARIAGFLIVLFWSVSMGWLVAHDVWPAWTAQDAPVLRATDWIKTEGKETQAGLYDKHGRVGTIWTNYLIDENSIQREDLVSIERFSVPIVPLYVSVDSVFTADGFLDEFTVDLLALDMALKLHGERFHSDFSFVLDCGPTHRDFKIPLADAGMISGAFNPFAQLTDLHVGQSWRMQVFNPVAAATGVGKRFVPMLVRVVGEETIRTAGGQRTCFVVESSGVKAWVDKQGVVRRQEVTLPVGGLIRMVPEPLSEARRNIVRRLYNQAKSEYRG